MTAHTAGMAWFGTVIAVLLAGWLIDIYRGRPRRNKRGSNLPPPDSSCARNYCDQ